MPSIACPAIDVCFKLDRLKALAKPVRHSDVSYSISFPRPLLNGNDQPCSGCESEG